MYDILVTGGTVVDPGQGVNATLDVAVEGGQVAAVAAELRGAKARRFIDAAGKYVFPGLVDTHVHLSPPFGGAQGHRMLARAGVTTALDMAGVPELLLRDLETDGAGLTIGFVYPLIPGDTTSGAEPSRAELTRLVETAVEQGAMGVKILGGHFPLSPEATETVIGLAHERRCWCAVHAGTTATGSDIEGLEELIDLAAGRPVHVAHVNSYCRGQKTGDPLVEASRALKALGTAPQTRSESYLALINGADATIESGAPKSNVVKTCLRTGGYEATSDGMEAAIRAGWARIQGVRHGETVLLPPDEGLAFYHERQTRVGISFPVNPPGAAFALAVAKANGRFTVTALATDGGAIPRNTTLEQGLALVRFGALTIEEFVLKACLAPARMMGFVDKGHLAPGADADLAVVDPVTTRPEWVVAEGQVIVEAGRVVGRGGRIAATEAGRAFLTARKVEHRVTRPDWL